MDLSCWKRSFRTIRLLAVVGGLVLVQAACRQSPPQSAEPSRADAPAETDPAHKEQRAFVTQCLADPKVFVLNPPVGQDPYRNLSYEEKEKRMLEASRNGALLMLTPDGLPSKFWTKRNSKEHGLRRVWFPNGQLHIEEEYDQGKLVGGRYWDANGQELSKVENGRGVRTLFGDPPRGESGEVRTREEYEGGVRHGETIAYWDYDEDRISRWEMYRQGELQESRNWMRSGQLNVEMRHANGRSEGQATYWYPNGQVQSELVYDKGRTVSGVRYFEDGTKQEEWDETTRRWWYPSGQLMLEKVSNKEHRLVSGRSFDPWGKPTGEVREGHGVLIAASNYGDSPRLEQIRNGAIYEPRSLPLPGWGGGYGPGSRTLSLQVSFGAANDGSFDGGTLKIHLPEGVTSSGPLQFDLPALESGYKAELGTVKFEMPTEIKNWTGEILAEVEGKMEGQEVRYAWHVFRNKARDEKPPPVRREKIAEKPRRQFRASGRSLPAIRVGTTKLGGKPVESWSLGKRQWRLYDDPPMLVASEDGETWRKLRGQMAYRPHGLIVLNADRLVVWGTKPTRDVREGIPFFVEESNDGGKTWANLPLPGLDYLLSLEAEEGEEGQWAVRGIRLPKDGLPEGKHWYELEKTLYISNDGRHFTEPFAGGFFGGDHVSEAVQAPNGHATAFLTVGGFTDTSYTVLLAREPDEIPFRVFSPGENGSLVWSADSRILALERDGKYTGFYDTRTGESAVAAFPYKRWLNARELDENEAFHKKVAALMAGARP